MLARYRVSWTRSGAELAAFEPTKEEVAAVAADLAAAYNDEHNRAMMAHGEESTPAAVASLYAEMQRAGGRPFVLTENGALMGDADFRKVTAERAEFAIMVGARSQQGRGYGTLFGVMLHHFAFAELGLERVYATILPANRASLALFAKLGYRRDDSREARAFADYADDVTMSLTRADFERAHTSALGGIAWTVR